MSEVEAVEMRELILKSEVEAVESIRCRCRCLCRCSTVDAAASDSASPKSRAAVISGQIFAALVACSDTKNQV